MHSFISKTLKEIRLKDRNLNFVTYRIYTDVPKSRNTVESGFIIDVRNGRYVFFLYIPRNFSIEWIFDMPKPFIVREHYY